MPAAADPARCEALLADACWELVRTRPFFGHLLAAFDRRIDDTVPTAGVGPGHLGRPVLYVNPRFFTRGLRTGETRAAVLEHEVLHVVFGHIELDPARMPNPKRRNIAADLVVNQHVGHRLPASAVTIKRLGLPCDLTVEAYYDRLNDRSDAALAGLVGEPELGHDRWGVADGGGEGDSDGKRFRDLLSALREDAIERGVRDGTFGALPGGLRDAIAGRRQRFTADPFWKQALRLFSQRTARAGIRSTTQRESRRYGADRVGWAGPIVPGLRRRRIPSLLVAIDTSGSIHPDLFSLFFEQIGRLVASGARVHVVECDCIVQRDYPWTGVVPTYARGGGGTSFDPVFTWLRGPGKSLGIGGCVYLTDGEAAPPTVRPPCPLLWVITPGGTRESTRFGPAVAMPRPLELA